MDQQQVQKDQVIWHDTGVPMSSLFDDPYFSLEDGLAETRHVFLDGNDLPLLLQSGFRIAELGFGTGLNALATLELWDRLGLSGSFRFTSFEAFPMPVEDMQKSLAAWPELKAYADHLLSAWRDGRRVFEIGAMQVEIIEGDVRETLSDWEGQADAWYLDGFSPARNPEMWAPEVMAAVGDHTVKGGSFATYTAASFVRASLSDAGFDVQRVAGYGRKRHMSVGRK